jgi:hypothetical protein
MASIFIDIASQFTGEKSFKKADSATDKLTKNVKNLGKTLGVTLSVGAILAFGKAAVKAAAEDEKAQKQLALALNNVGLGRDVAASEAYIQKLQSEFGIVDDQLRPAYQSLAIATKSTSESQKLMNIALDIAASKSLDVGQVTAALSKAYLGNNTALGKLGVGISKADLKAGNFNDIMNQLAKTFKGAASQSANTFSGKMARLTVSIENAKEILGKGLIDSFMILTESQGIEELQVKIENFATSASENLKKLAGFLKENEILLKSIFVVLAATFVSTKIIAGIAATITAIGLINKAYQALRATAIGTAIASMFALNPYGAALQVAAMVALIGITIAAVNDLTESYNNANDAKNKLYDPDATGLNHLRELESRYNSASLKEKKKLTTEEIKTLNAKKLQLAIDKAKIALGKGDDVFDINKIQLAAAELNQAQLLGKVTNSAQLLQITNDLARLNVKQSILALEDAIASKDIKAIEAGTAKLNKDLAILGALTNQEVKLRDIESILKDIIPKDLINIANLDEAIAKLKLIGDTKTIVPLGTPTPTTPSNKPLTPSQVEDLLILGRTVPIVPDSSGGVGYSGNAGNYAPSGFPMGNTGGTTKVEVTVVAPPFTDPNAVAEAINDFLQNARDRGTLVTN